MRTSWIKWTLIPFAAASLLGSIDSPVAVGAPKRISGSASSGAPFYPDLVYCSSAQRCLGIGTINAQTTSDGGRHWTRGTTFLHGDMGVHAMSCPSPQTCLAVGSYEAIADERVNGLSERRVTTRPTVVRTTDGGRTWALMPPLPRDIVGMTDISCPTRSYCLAVGSTPDDSASDALVTTNLGRSWRRLDIPSDERLASVACTSRSACIAAGNLDNSPLSVIYTSDGGTTWMQSALPIDGYLHYPAGLTCLGRTRCFMVGKTVHPESGFEPGYIIESTDGGRTWTDDVLPPGAPSLSELSCASATTCVVTGGPEGTPLLTTENSGTTWIVPALPPSVASLEGVSCPTKTWCIAVGFGPPDGGEPGVGPSAVVVTHNGGATWTVEWPKVSQ
jgi:photosystem II stability/assembly factor-like uncharacterized protein